MVQNVPHQSHHPAKARRVRALLLSDRVYRILLAAYPLEFRRRYSPEMAQVFRTCCRQAYNHSGAPGVMRLWLPALWDWAWSAAGERIACLFRRFKVNNTQPWLMHSKQVTWFFLLAACLASAFCCVGTGVLASPPLLGIETCRLDLDNQSGETIRITPVYTNGLSYSAIRIYRTSWPIFPAFQQRNIAVKSGDIVTLSVDCSQHGVTELYACDLSGECYIHQHNLFLYQPVSDTEMSVSFDGYRFTSLESLPRPDAALEAAVKSFPEHDYTGLRDSLLCLLPVIFWVVAIYRLVRVRE